MLGSFFSRILLLITGYIYPAYECYKILDKKKRDYDQLKFWCKYWIILAMLTAVERVADVFFSWLPLYGEGKILFVIYLWNSHTHGVDFMYEEFFRPLILKHEADIDVWLSEMKIRSMDYMYQKWRHLYTNALKMYFNHVTADQNLNTDSNSITTKQHVFSKHQVLVPHPRINEWNEEEENQVPTFERRQLNFPRNNDSVLRDWNGGKENDPDEMMVMMKPSFYQTIEDEDEDPLLLSTHPSSSPASPSHHYLRSRNIARTTAPLEYENHNDVQIYEAAAPRRTTRRRTKG